MSRCADVDPLITPYVDGAADPPDQATVAAHLDGCSPCRRHAEAEQAARLVLGSHAATLTDRAPDGLRTRCALMTGGGFDRRAGRTAWLRWPAPWPLALAATLVLACGSALLYVVILQPAEAVAAQLTLDHVKCFTLFDRSDGLDPAEVQASLKSRYGWDVSLPGRADAEAGALTLVGGRRCVYLDGAVAHLLYKRGDVPVSLFMLPDGVELASEVQVLGHVAIAFRHAGRTYVVLARQSRDDMRKIAEHFGRVAH